LREHRRRGDPQDAVSCADGFPRRGGPAPSPFALTCRRRGLRLRAGAPAELRALGDDQGRPHRRGGSAIITRTNRGVQAEDAMNLADELAYISAAEMEMRIR